MNVVSVERGGWVGWGEKKAVRLYYMWVVCCLPLLGGWVGGWVGGVETLTWREQGEF